MKRGNKTLIISIAEQGAPEGAESRHSAPLTPVTEISQFSHSHGQ